MIGFFLFLLSIDLLPHYFFVLLILLVIYKNRHEIFYGKINKKDIVIVSLILCITLLSCINSLVHIKKLDSLFNLFPYTSLMLGSFVIGKYIPQKDIKILIILVTFEATIGIFEFLMGINTILIWKEYFVNYKLENYGAGLFYFNTAFGISENSSSLAEKILMSILLIHYFKLFDKKRLIFLFPILILGLVFSFQRTSILVLVIFYVLVGISKLWKFISAKRIALKLNLKLQIIIFFLIGISIISVYKSKDIYNQFARGNEKIELSGREIIWPQFTNFIKENLWFGYYSQKFRIKYTEKSTAQAHNSFLQVLANHGVIIFMFFIVLIVFSIKSYNWIYITALLIYSLFQYALFWGISLIDVVFFIFILQTPYYKKTLKCHI